MADAAQEDVDERLSKDLGIDVSALEVHARLRLDLLRMQRGDPGELGYVLVERQGRPGAAVAFESVEAAMSAVEGHPLIRALSEDGGSGFRVPDPAALADLASREVLLP